MSTGPTSPDGKSRASMNRLTHGCCSEKLILPNENEEDWIALREAWFNDYAPNDDHPDNPTFTTLLEATARAEWFLWRKTRQYNEAEQSIYTTYGDSIDWAEADHLKIERFTRYRTTAERTFQRLRNMVEQTRRTRALEAHRRRVLEVTLARETRIDKKPAKNANPSAEPEQRSGPLFDFDLEAYLKPKPKIPQLIQTVEVLSEDGKTTTNLYPPNEELLEESKSMDPPPVKVSRMMYFHGGIPPVYRWVRKEFLGSTTGRDQILTFDEWLAILKQERERFNATGHIGPKDPADLALCDMTWDEVKILLQKLSEEHPS